jgi:hypothetical protein
MHTGLDPLNWTATIMRGQGCAPPHNLHGCDSAPSADYVFLPRLLKSAGYQNHMRGKVLGHAWLRSASTHVLACDVDHSALCQPF